MSEFPSARERLTFLVLGIAILVFIDQIMLGGDRPYFDKIKEDVAVESQGVAEDQLLPDEEEASVFDDMPDDSDDDSYLNIAEAQEYVPSVPDDVYGPSLSDGYDSYEEDYFLEDNNDAGFSEVEDLKSSLKSLELVYHPVLPFVKFVPSVDALEIPAWVQNSVKVHVPDGVARVVVIIDDMGVNSLMSEAVVGLPGPLTLSYLPYASDVSDLVGIASERGHEIMVHVPMEPLNDKLDPGQGVLTTDMSSEELSAALDSNLDVFDNYVGINNHMGSRLTQSAEAMALVMAEMKLRGLLFVDSRTISTSVADDTAEAYGVAHVSRDVFLDHNSDYESVRKSLEKLEEVALEHGYAVAIGHPKKNTIKALYEWLPTLGRKGIALVPVSDVVTVPVVPESSSVAAVSESSKELLPQPE